jgi:hypothetical protein
MSSFGDWACGILLLALIGLTLWVWVESAPFVGV